MQWPLDLKSSSIPLHCYCGNQAPISERPKITLWGGSDRMRVTYR
jgi:hypothetical protein